MADQAKLTLARPKDRSLEAFKTWIQNIVKKINPGADEKMTDQEWQDAHQKFWAKIDQNS